MMIRNQCQKHDEREREKKKKRNLTMMMMMPTINHGQKHDKEKVKGEKNIYMTIAKRVSSN